MGTSLEIVQIVKDNSYANTFNSVDEMDKLPEIYNLPKLTQTKEKI